MKGAHPDYHYEKCEIVQEEAIWNDKVLRRRKDGKQETDGSMQTGMEDEGREYRVKINVQKIPTSVHIEVLTNLGRCYIGAFGMISRFEEITGGD